MGFMALLAGIMVLIAASMTPGSFAPLSTGSAETFNSWHPAQGCEPAGKRALGWPEYRWNPLVISAWTGMLIAHKSAAATSMEWYATDFVSSPAVHLNVRTPLFERWRR